MPTTTKPLRVQGDIQLARLFQQYGESVEWSYVTRTDFLATAANPLVTKRLQHFVDLSCGHKALVKLRTRRTRCRRCIEMQRHGMDYDGFLHHNVRDTLIWREDPCRAANEPTDLEGHFIEDDLDDRELPTL